MRERRTHAHPRPRGRGPLLVALAVTTTFMVVEVVGGLVSRSLALLADAGHMFTDVGALGLALVASWAASRPPSIRRSYGYGRVEVLAALANGLFLWLVVAWIVWEAYRRFQEPPEVRPVPMLVVATWGLMANIAAALVLRSPARHSLNVRGAFLHVMGDALGSVGAILAGLLILFLGWYPADLLVSLFIGALIVAGSIRLVWQSVHVLLEGTPEGIDLGELEAALHGAPGVQAVHDLHVWSLTSGYNALSAHIVLREPQDPATRQDLLTRLHRLVEERFPIHHVTLQLEEGPTDCEEAHPPPCDSPHPPQTYDKG